MLKQICLFGFLFIFIFVISASAQKQEIPRSEITKVVDYVHENYREDYTALHGGKTLDWQKAIVAMMFVHAYEVLGDEKYLDWANDALYVEYNISDDQCWGANAILELNRHGIKPSPKPYIDGTGNSFQTKYSYEEIFEYGLTTEKGKAPAPFTGFYDNPEAGGKGGIFWNREFATYNTCTMGQAIVLAYLMPEKRINGNLTKEYASEWLNLQCDLLLDPKSGLVYDNYRLRSGDRNRGNYSYNNGTVLAALGLGWAKDSVRHRNAPEIAEKLVDYVVENMSKNGVLYSPSADFRNNNAHAFNGIFMHFIPYYLFSTLPSSNKVKMKKYIENCATSVWKQIENNRAHFPNDYSVSYLWNEEHQTATANCMTTVSGAECLLTWLQIEEKSK